MFQPDLLTIPVIDPLPMDVSLASHTPVHILSLQRMSHAIAGEFEFQQNFLIETYDNVILIGEWQYGQS
jgi:hypothetical protein